MNTLGLLALVAVAAVAVWTLRHPPAENELAAAIPTPDASIAEASDQADSPDTDRVAGLGQVTFDPSHSYAFPIAASPDLYVWTHYHWDGINAVDIEARFGFNYAQFRQVTSAELVAVTAGTVQVYSGAVGGTGYVLQGDDGFDYYYAHMSEQWVPDGAQVAAGQSLGRMGRTGDNAQYIEPHLHLAIGPRDTLWNRLPSVNAAEWLYNTFGLPWDDRPSADQDLHALPQGRPVQHPALIVVTPFDQATASGLPQPAIELGFPGAPPAESLDVYATIDGEVNVIRWTTIYGHRLQITNPAADTTVVISGISQWLVQDGEWVSRGQHVARWDPRLRSRLHYMIYRNGGIIDPTPTLGVP